MLQDKESKERAKPIFGKYFFKSKDTRKKSFINVFPVKEGEEWVLPEKPLSPES